MLAANRVRQLPTQANRSEILQRSAVLGRSLAGANINVDAVLSCRVLFGTLITILSGNSSLLIIFDADITLRGLSVTVCVVCAH